ncbi:ATP-dependent zinc protease family protein [Microbulbifer taiwanensis]|uniref:ATP-dependent zinc protease family protein n=1 Tax=Microbulbifer taiwanensis TaxID=986746 RepID=UPI0029BFEC08|nr:RimK/LysX family protein [Microbulbifer taiwanensis]
MLASQLLVGCESLHYPWQKAPAPAGPGDTVATTETPDAGAQCPEPVEVVCAEPEVKVVERVIERRFEKVVEVPVAKDKLVLGAVETVAVEPGGLILDSVIDTGSSTSSLSARELTPFERDGKDWVRFKLELPGSKNEDPLTLELPIKRQVRVSRPGFDSQRRPVVEMSLTVGDVTHMVEVNLTDRSSSEYLMLIGRNFLKDAAVVDVSRRNVQGAPKLPNTK